MFVDKTSSLYQNINLMRGKVYYYFITFNIIYNIVFYNNPILFIARFLIIKDHKFQQFLIFYYLLL
jgi:hypothetical protein